MSQFIIPIDQTRQAQVGWDPPLQTYYGQVYKIDKNGERVDIFVENDEEKDGTLVWVGTSHNEVPTVEYLQLLLHEHVTIPPNIRGHLELEQEGESRGSHLARHLGAKLRKQAGVYGTHLGS